MRKTDISKYVGTPNSQSDKTGVATVKAVFKTLLKALLTIFWVFLITGLIVGTSLIVFIMGMKDETVNLDLHSLKLNYTSFIYVNSEQGKPVEYQRLYSSENRVWVDYNKIPKHMINAMIAIEDKRFIEHNGVDWIRTFGAATNLLTGSGSYGGSTITQQLIKNITGESEVSLTRKVKEIFRALNLEKKYSKEQILEAYLNVVNFGSGCKGVQAAANLYFGKDINQCDIAECAAIAGITQNPSKYSPLISPKTKQNNKVRQQIVIQAMYDQEKISKSEYDVAMAKSNNMPFAGKKAETIVDDIPIQNWYVDAMFEDVVEDLQKKLNCSAEKATSMMYHGGLKIYSAMDLKTQKIAEEAMKSTKIVPESSKLQAGFFMMDYNGRVIATVGNRNNKMGNRLFSYATDAQRQVGSTIKPISVYGPALSLNKINYSSILPDEPIDNYFANGTPGPNNWYRSYKGKITVEYALRISANAPAAQLCKMISPKTCFDFLTEKLKFTHLDPNTDRYQLAAMALGGVNGGATVREMTAGFQIFGNGGKYYRPYTYYYVEDHDGKILLDNRKELSSQVMSSPNATIMHKLLRNVIYGAEGTGGGAAISGWEVFGKTGTTDDDKDSWFIGGTPCAVAGIWTGYVKPSRIKPKVELNAAKNIWKSIMSQYLKDKEKLKFTFDSNVISATYCTETGKIAGEGCTKTMVGWYEKGKLPTICNGIHPNASSQLQSTISDINSSKIVSELNSNGASSNTESSSKLQPESSEISSEKSSTTTSSNSHSSSSSSKPDTSHAYPTD